MGAPGSDAATKRGLVVPAVRLLYRKLAASTTDDILHPAGFHELESVAESASLANEGEKLHLTGRKRKLQTYHLPDGNFLTQQRGNSRFADVHCVSADNRAAARIHANLHIQLKAAMAAGFHNFVRWVSFESTLLFQVKAPRTRDRLNLRGTLGALESIR